MVVLGLRLFIIERERARTVTNGVTMNKVYIVYQQSYEEFYLYGIFSTRGELNDALVELATSEQHLKLARESREESIVWYETTHKPWAERVGMEPRKPPCMTMSLHDYSVSRFSVRRIETDKVTIDPDVLGTCNDSE